MTTHPAPADHSGQHERPPRRLGMLTRPGLLAACLASAGAMPLPGAGIASASPVQPAQAGPPKFVTGVGGDGQNTTTRSPFAEPLKVQVYDENGHPSADATA